MVRSESKRKKENQSTPLPLHRKTDSQGRECNFFHALYILKASQPWRQYSLRHPESAQGVHKKGPNKEMDSRESKLWLPFWTIKVLNRKLESLNLKARGILKVKQESLHSTDSSLNIDWINNHPVSIHIFSRTVLLKKKHFFYQIKICFPITLDIGICRTFWNNTYWRRT